MATDLQDLSRRLYATADQLWTNSALRPDQYAQPVLALIALRQMEAQFELVRAELAPVFKGRLRAQPEDYRARGAMFLPEGARFSRLLALPGTADLGAELNAAMKAIADANPELAGALPSPVARKSRRAWQSKSSSRTPGFSSPASPTCATSCAPVGDRGQPAPPRWR
jgi:type I restriction enzyme M protein